MDSLEVFLGTENGLNWQYLLAELARIDVLIQREVHCWQLAGQDPQDDFRGLYVSDAAVQALLELPFGTNWGHSVRLSDEENDKWNHLLTNATRFSEKLLKRASKSGKILRLTHLANVFKLSRFDLDVLLICIAPALDLRYERLYGYLQDDITHKRPGVNLVLNLLCDHSSDRWVKLNRFADSQPLFKYRLLERAAEQSLYKTPLLNQSLAVDETIVNWLMGNYQLSAGLGSQATLQLPSSNMEDKFLAGEGLHHINISLTHPPILAFYGPDLDGQVAAARCIASDHGRPLLMVNLSIAKEEELAQESVIDLALRDALLIGAIPCLIGWDTCQEEKRSFSNLLMKCCLFPELIILAGRNSWQASGLERERPIHWIEFPIPAFNQRRELWNYYLSHNQPTESMNLFGLAGQFQLTSGQIRDAFTAARDMALQQGRLIENQDVFAAARHYSNPKLIGLAHKLVPRYTWSDIVLPEDQIDQLKEIVATVRGRSIVLDEWKIGQKLASSRGVTILFSGPPGTGKTMAAEVIAGELSLDLFKIDLSTIVSKYIGETEKNLEHIFSEAETSNAILFFDEADALFGKRSEVRDSHDRYANIEISYLLQRMEAYDGVTILATNLRSNLDESFTRRLQFSVDFPFPTEVYRLRIWRTLFPAEVPRDADLDLPGMANRFKLAGGNIRNIIIGAAYLAAFDGGKVCMEHLLHSTRRELQKMGRLIGDEDLILQND
jgi:ATP-dependent 26S proteasome regulatory subunit